MIERGGGTLLVEDHMLHTAMAFEVPAGVPNPLLGMGKESGGE